MSGKAFPYAGWVLLPSFKPVELTFVSRDAWFSAEYHQAQGGKSYKADCIHPSKAAAIDAGHADLTRQQQAIDKKQQNLNKRRSILKKASDT